MKCPKCGSENISKTLMGFSYLRDPGPDKNIATCGACGESGVACDWGAPLISPLKGTENWTDEQIASWDWSKVKYRSYVGVGICNTKAIRKLDV